jgi:hypothetical protein
MVKFPVFVAGAFVALMTAAAVLSAPAHTDIADAQFISFLNSHGTAVQGLAGIQTNYSEDTAATFLGGR